MKATDARRHNPDQLKLLRERGFAMRRDGFRVPDICKALGVARATVYKWFKNAEQASEEEASSAASAAARRALAPNSRSNRKCRFASGFLTNNPSR